MIGDIVSLVLTLIAGAGVILLTYYASKWYVKKAGAIGSGNHLKIVDRLVVSKTGSIVVVDLDGVQYMIGVSEQNIQIMKQLDMPIVMPEEKAQWNNPEKLRELWGKLDKLRDKE